MIEIKKGSVELSLNEYLDLLRELETLKEMLKENDFQKNLDFDDMVIFDEMLNDLISYEIEINVLELKIKDLEHDLKELDYVKSINEMNENYICNLIDRLKKIENKGDRK